jgi:hypothetical protein
MPVFNSKKLQDAEGELLMDKKLYYVLGTIFIIVSGFLYTIERGIAYYSWIGQRISASQVGSFSSNPELPGLLSNIYIPVFVIIGVIFYALGYKKR